MSCQSSRLAAADATAKLDGVLPFGSLADEAGAWGAYEALLTKQAGGGSARGPLVDPGNARTSQLMWRLFGRDTSQGPDRGAQTMTQIPSDHVDLLSDDERRIFVEWIDLGAQWDLPIDRGSGGRRGRSHSMRAHAYWISLLVCLATPLIGQSTAPFFTDVTEEAGVQFRHSFGDVELTNIVEGTGPVSSSSTSTMTTTLTSTSSTAAGSRKSTTTEAAICAVS